MVNEILPNGLRAKGQLRDVEDAETECRLRLTDWPEQKPSPSHHKRGGIPMIARQQFGKCTPANGGTRYVLQKRRP